MDTLIDKICFQVNDKKQRLTLPALLEKHQGQYTCIVTNLLGSIMHTVKVETLDHNIYNIRTTTTTMTTNTHASTTNK